MHARRLLTLLAAATLLVPACSATNGRREPSSQPSIASPSDIDVRRREPTPSVLSASSASPRRAPYPSVYRDPLAVARQWMIAAHSSSWVDATPGAWTGRTRSLVTGAEAAAERFVRIGAGGSTWRQIVERHCSITLRGLNAAPLADVRQGRRARIVDVAATQVLSCGDGTVQLTPVSAQVVLRLVAGRWLVAQVTR